MIFSVKPQALVILLLIKYGKTIAQLLCLHFSYINKMLETNFTCLLTIQIRLIQSATLEGVGVMESNPGSGTGTVVLESGKRAGSNYRYCIPARCRPRETSWYSIIQASLVYDVNCALQLVNPKVEKYQHRFIIILLLASEMF